MICEALGRGDSNHWIYVADGSRTEVYLDRSSRIPGYCLVVWNGEHVAEPTELAPEAADGYWRDVVATGRAVAGAFEPLKVNYFTLGNSVPHLHTHVVPRYREDPAPGGPIPWGEVVGSPAFSEEELRGQADALHARLDPGT